MQSIKPRQYAEALYQALQEQPETKTKLVIDNFIKLISSRNDRKKLPEILRILSAVFAEHGKSFQVRLTTRTLLEAERQQEILTQLKQHLGADIQMTSVVDERILGGAIARINNTQFDGSLRTKIHKLYKQFIS